ncbi:hypothetical protein BT69DRAFT_1296443 [Atractiella rhizophila]|nr:hypothetical protein BT69DRAFT_1296443 [Atractiella rhizophila]
MNFPESRGYWTTVEPSRKCGPVLAQKQNFAGWFKDNLWFVEDGFSSIAKRFIIIPKAGMAHSYQWKVDPEVVVEWHSFKDLSVVFGHTQKMFRAHKSPIHLNIKPTLWPLDDPYTTTFRIRNLSLKETEQSVLKQFPYLSRPERLFLRDWKDKNGQIRDRYAIWDCPSNSELREAMRRGPVGEVEKGRWVMRHSANGSILLADLMRGAGFHHLASQHVNDWMRSEKANTEAQLGKLFTRATRVIQQENAKVRVNPEFDAV